MMTLFIGPAELTIIMVVIAFLLLIVLLPLLALINLLQSTFESGTDKIVWVVVILLFPIVGSILYFVLSPKQKISKG